jgi:hypothetical protein
VILRKGAEGVFVMHGRCTATVAVASNANDFFFQCSLPTQAIVSSVARVAGDYTFHPAQRSGS